MDDGEFVSGVITVILILLTLTTLALRAFFWDYYLKFFHTTHMHPFVLTQLMASPA